LSITEPKSRDGDPFETSDDAPNERDAETLMTSILRSFKSPVF
jgi:hypothetical protein